jgi:hypothetical protein
MTHRRLVEVEEAATVFRALNDNRPLTVEEALDFGLHGWNLRCNRCGSYGAEWMSDQRPGWGALAVCPPHRDELRAELRRHHEALQGLREVNFHQPSAAETQKQARLHRRNRKARQQ